MLSPTGVFLAALYGPWPVTTQHTETNAQGISITVGRDRTLHLPRSTMDGDHAAEFIDRLRSSDRVWYVGHRGWSDAVVAAMANAGLYDPDRRRDQELTPLSRHAVVTAK